MPETVIEVPSRLTLFEVLDFSTRLPSYPQSDEYLLNFGNVGHVEPFGMVFGSALIRQFNEERKKSNPAATIKAYDFAKNEYASIMGFYKSFGLQHGYEPGEAAGSSRYLPLTKVLSNALRNRALAGMEELGTIIEAEALRLSKILIRQESGDLLDAITFSVREIFRNVVEHSESPHFWYAAQYWPTKSRVEVAILDEGIGIRTSLLNSGRYVVESDEHALQLAIRPGVSRMSGGPGKRSDVWANSGYGLFMTSSLCQCGGDFSICSQSKTLFMKDGVLNSLESNFKGTAIRLVIDTTKIGNLNRMLAEIRTKGDEIEKEVGKRGRISASMIARIIG